MYTEENNEHIRIILNKNQEIQYASIGREKAIDFIERKDVLSRLSDALPVEYDMGDYSVSIDKVKFSGSQYYIVTAAIRHPKCLNCKRPLTDSVTGLYNRNYWEKIVKDVDLSRRIQDFSLIFIDVDNLKEINDTYGHQTGDMVIKTVGRAIRNSIRKEDAGLRYGGDEFIILLFNQDKEVALKVVDRIRREINRLSQGLDIDIQISAGIAYYNSLRNMADIIKMADRDLYKEKRTKYQKKEKQEK